MHESSLQQMNVAAEKAAAFLGGLASPHRLRILCRLAEGEQNVSQLIEKTGIPQTSMSQHLNRLKDEGIVSFRREHRVLYYFVTDPTALEVMKILYNRYCADKKEQQTDGNFTK